jgi:hypothetical protein
MLRQSTECNSQTNPEECIHASAKRKLSLMAFLKPCNRIIIVFFLTACCVAALGQEKKPEQIKAAAAKPDSTTVLDDSYGRGGTKLTITHTSTHNVFGIVEEEEEEEIIFLDPKDVVRERRIKVQYKGAGQRSNEFITIYGIKTGNKIYDKTVMTDEGGNIMSFREERFKDEREPGPGGFNIQTYGYWWSTRGGDKEIKKYNTKTKKYEDAGNTAMPDNTQVMTKPAVNTTNISFHSNEAFIGPAYLNISNAGQGNSGYGSFGFTGEYTRFITPHFGATMDVGVYFKKETQNDFTQSFTQFNVTAGATYIPCKDPWKEDKKFTGDLHLLLGLSSIMVKESSGSYGLDNISKNCFTFALGAAGDYHISPRIKIRLQADYMHTSFFNTMQNNFRISAGPTIGF